MSKFIIKGGKALSGEIAVHGSKNAILPILAASILNGKKSILHNCPRLRDVDVMIRILQKLGAKVNWEGSSTIIVDSSGINSTEIPDDLAAEMRSSIIFLGPILSRFGKVTISYPGGCISSRAHKFQTFSD